MSSYSQNQGAAILRKRLGFRGSNAQVTTAFQFGYGLGTPLVRDGAIGPKTSAAIARSLANGGRASAHFFWSEFDCTCRGRFPECRGVLVMGGLLWSLEKLRAQYGPVGIISGYRCIRRNREVGSNDGSQHPLGSAADVHLYWTNTRVRNLHVFGGIGRAGSNGQVRHVDRRDISGKNNGGSLERPVEWVYTNS